MRVGRGRAQALVELALVTPLLVLLAFALIGVARLQLVRMELDAVARETARAAVLQPLPPFPNAEGTPERWALRPVWRLVGGTVLAADSWLTSSSTESWLAEAWFAGTRSTP